MTDSDTKKTRGVSPVIGVILMVAVVVILAALIGVYAIALSDSNESNVNAGVETDTTEEGVLVRWNSKGNADEITVLVNGEPVNNARLSGVGDSVTVSTGADDTVTVVGIGPDGNQTQLQTTTPSSDTTGGSGDPQVVSGGGGPPGEEVTGLVRINPKINGANVISYDTSGTQIDTATTDSEGNYTINAVENGEIVVSVEGSDSYNGNPLYAGASKTVSDTSSSVEFDFDETQVSTATVDGQTVSVVYQTQSGSSNQIANVGQLQALTESANSDKSYQLVRDIDASGTSSWNGGSGFAPITGFSGSLNGQGYAIDGLTINRSSNSGLFKSVTGGSVSDMSISNADIVGATVNGVLGAKIENTTVSNVHVSGSIDATDTSNFYKSTGGAVGILRSGSTITVSSANVDINGADNIPIGGLVGENEGTITKSYATGSVSGPHKVSGFVSDNEGTIKNSYATGEIDVEDGTQQVAGFVETNSGTLENVYTASSMSAKAQDASQVGGFYSASSQEPTTGTYWDLSTTSVTRPSSDYSVDLLRGQGSPSSGFGVAYGYESGKLTGSEATCTFIEFDFGGVWSTTSSYPQLVDNPESESAIQETQPSCEYNEAFNNMAGSGTSSDPYQITNLDQLQAMKYDTSAHYQLQNDIDASPTSSWNNGKGFEPVNRRTGEFTGSLDGNGYTIDGLYIDRTSVEHHASLLGTVNGAEVTDLTMTNVDITGKSSIGSIADSSVLEDEADPITISNTHVSGNLTSTANDYDFNAPKGGLIAVTNDNSVVEFSSADVEIDAPQRRTGGLVGEHHGTVKQSYAKGTISGTTGVAGGLVAEVESGATVKNSYSKVNVQVDAQQIGGLVGYNNGTVQNTYVVGSVADQGQSGAGFSAQSNIASDFYWDTDATGQSVASDDGSIENSVELTTSEMQGSGASSNMSNLDFSSIWTTTSGYPELQNNRE